MANERRLIDANALPVTTLTDGGYWTKDVVYASDVDAAPTVAAVEVCYCKDCKFYEAGVEYYGGGTKDICRLFKRQMQNKDFCSYGEKSGTQPQREDV